MSTDENPEKSLSIHFSSGVLSLESFVQILDETPHDISAAAAQRMMPYLLDLVNEAHRDFKNAESKIQKINDRLDNDLQDIVVREKTTNDDLCQAQEDLAKLEEKGKVLQGQRNELERQLSNHEENLRRDRRYLQEKKDKLRKEEKERVPKAVATGVLVGIVGGVLLGPAGALLGGTVGGVATNEALKRDIENAERAVREASNQVDRTRGRIDDKKSELSNLTAQTEKERENHNAKRKELEMLKLRKKEIKDSQVRLGKLNESIKSCMVLVSTTTSRANMMAIEANGELPDIEAMIFPLKAIAGDLSEASLSNSPLLSGHVDIKGIGCKIQMITSKVQLAITQGDMDEWA